MRVALVPRFRWLVLLQALCGVAILITTFTPAPIGLLDPATGTVIDSANSTNTVLGVVGRGEGQLRPIVAQTKLQLALLGVSRFTGFTLYPVLVLAFLSKCKALANFIELTPVSMFSFADPHELHVHCGRYIAFDIWIHMTCHLMRWISAGNGSVFWVHQTSRSGLLAAGCVVLIAFPMLYLKRLVAYEIRKLLHFLFIPMAVALCYHVPSSAIPNGGYMPYILGGCLCIYLLDAWYVTLFMTEMIETTTFHVLPSGVQMTFEVSESFRKRRNQGGYVTICLPWVDRTQWHAFSVYEFSEDRSKRQVFIMKTGNWTQSVHDALQRSTVRPVWIQGPFTSPYNSAIKYDNQILVATGIGITPALSVISSQKGSRRVNLIWMVRDPTMLEFFMERTELDEQAWNLIFYTGTTPLNPAMYEMRSSIRIFTCRPNLQTAIPNIIYGIESGEGLPDFHTKEDLAREDLAYFADTLDADEEAQKFKALNKEARKRGYCLEELVNPTVPIQVGPKGREMAKMLNPSQRGTFTAARSRGGRRLTPLSTSKPLASDLAPDSPLFPDPLPSLFPGSFPHLGGKRVRPSLDSDSLLAAYGKNTLMKTPSFAKGREGREKTSGPGLAKSLSMFNQEVKECAAKKDGGLGSKSLTTITSTAGTSEDLPDLPIKQYDPELEEEPFEVHEPNVEAQSFVLGLDRSVMDTWGILYCGQCEPVAKSLTSISHKYQLSFARESFSW